MSEQQALLFVSEESEPCQTLFQRYKTQLGRVVDPINVHNPAYAKMIKAYGIRSVPTLVIVNKAKQQAAIYRKPKEIRSILDNAMGQIAAKAKGQQPTPQKRAGNDVAGSKATSTESNSPCGYDGCNNLQNDYSFEYDKPFSSQNSMAEQLLASGADGPSLTSDVLPRPQVGFVGGSHAEPPMSERIEQPDSNAMSSNLKMFEDRRKLYDEQMQQQNEKAYKMSLMRN